MSTTPHQQPSHGSDVPDNRKILAQDLNQLFQGMVTLTRVIAEEEALPAEAGPRVRALRDGILELAAVLSSRIQNEVRLYPADVEPTTSKALSFNLLEAHDRFTASYQEQINRTKPSLNVEAAAIATAFPVIEITYVKRDEGTGRFSLDTATASGIRSQVAAANRARRLLDADWITESQREALVQLVSKKGSHVISEKVVECFNLLRLQEKVDGYNKALPDGHRFIAWCASGLDDCDAGIFEWWNDSAAVDASATLKMPLKEYWLRLTALKGQKIPGWLAHYAKEVDWQRPDTHSGEPERGTTSDAIASRSRRLAKNRQSSSED